MRLNKVIWMVLAFMFIATAKSYYMPEIEIKAAVLENGDMKIEESRTYSFKGKFTWADYKLVLAGDQQIKDFKLSGDNISYSQDNSEDQGTYYIENADKYFYLKWFYSARNETKTFRIEYTLTNAVNLYEDITELYYKFIGEANPAWVHHVKIEISLPQFAEFGDVQAWAHGPLNGTVNFVNGKIVLSVDDLAQKQYVEARILFPVDWITQPQREAQGLQKGRIVAEESDYSEWANEQRRMAVIEQQLQQERDEEAKDVVLVVLMISAALFVFLYSKYGRSFNVSYNQKSDPNIPRDKHPALLNVFYYNKTVGSGALSTTLFELARKNYISIANDENHQKKWYESDQPVTITLKRPKWTSEKAGLLDFENDLIDFLFNQVAGGSDTVTSKQLKKASSKMQKWFRSWQKTVKAHLDNEPYYEKQSIKGTVISAVVMLIITILSMIAGINYSKVAFVAFAGGLLFFILSFSILRYTPGTKELRNKIIAFRNYLKKFDSGNMQTGTGFNYISDYFLMAIAFGLGKKKIDAIVSVIPLDQQRALFPWFIYASANSSPADFASAMSSVVNVAATSVSSAAGAGGGMSGGGGAGGGGAAGGAG
ncbi:MAG: DUF2207 domain-containing protein [Calditrichae bacterium]|nr:DUF2207 domain-containing protein [Calditrichia bacterium]